MRNLDTCKNDRYDGNFRSLNTEAVTKITTNVGLDNASVLLNQFDVHQLYEILKGGFLFVDDCVYFNKLRGIIFIAA